MDGSNASRNSKSKRYEYSYYFNSASKHHETLNDIEATSQPQTSRIKMSETPDRNIDPPVH
jgi:hypothetical protein